MTPLQFAHCKIGHDQYACSERNAQLLFWSRIIKFLSLATLPGFTMMLSQVDNPAVVRVGLAIVAIGVVPLWVWEVFSMVFGWDKQLSVCKQVARDGQKVYEEITSFILANGTDPAAMDSMQKKADGLHDLLIQENVSVSRDIDRYAQQKVMSENGYHCTDCGKKWVGKVILKPQWRWRQRREISTGARCGSCGQVV